MSDRIESLTAADFAQLEQWDRRHVWHPFTQMRGYEAERTLMIVRGEGPYLVDAEGRRYIDGTSSLWCNVHGHNVAEINAAIREQLDLVAHSTLLGATHVPAVRLARKLVELAPPGLTRVFYSDNGATAVESSLKMAFQYWRQTTPARPKKTKFLALDGAYHGDTVGSTSVGGVDRFHHLFRPLLFDVLRTPSPNCYRCPLGLTRAACQVDCAAQVEELVAEHHEELAAVIIEPLVQGAAGMIVAPDGYLRRIRDVTRKFGVLLIADEVAVGFGRTGTLFACEQEGVVPDFLCIAKGLTGGYLPLAATLTTEEVFQQFLGEPEEYRTFYYGHTFTGNPLGAAAALASIALLEQNQTVRDVAPRSFRLKHWLDRCAELPVVGDVRQKGLMAGIELVESRSDKRPFPPQQEMGLAVCRRARELGAILRPLSDVIVVMPPLNIPLETLDELGSIVYRSICDVCGCSPQGGNR